MCNKKLVKHTQGRYLRNKTIIITEQVKHTNNSVVTVVQLDKIHHFKALKQSKSINQISVAWFNTSKDFQKMNNHDKPSLQTTTSLTSKQFRPNERSTTKVIQDKKLIIKKLKV